LSVDALHDNDTADCVTPVTLKPDGTDGAVESADGEEQALVVPLAVVRAERFPAASTASTPSE
jgi:hypothetical protein